MAPITSSNEVAPEEQRINQTIEQIVESAPVRGNRLMVSLRRGQETVYSVSGNTIDIARCEIRGLMQQGWTPAWSYYDLQSLNQLLEEAGPKSSKVSFNPPPDV